MEADKNPDHLRQLKQRVQDFRDEFESLMELHTPTWRGTPIRIGSYTTLLDATLS
ncbi:MAG: hypothetical protein K2X97_17235 [Mycobacteriaceae bacterium]|nr:hypothetical protein [Mycobacteriaceae bacterium]